MKIPRFVVFAIIFTVVFIFLRDGFGVSQTRLTIIWLSLAILFGGAGYFLKLKAEEMRESERHKKREKD